MTSTPTKHDCRIVARPVGRWSYQASAPYRYYPHRLRESSQWAKAKNVDEIGRYKVEWCPARSFGPQRTIRKAKRAAARRAKYNLVNLRALERKLDKHQDEQTDKTNRTVSVNVSV